MLKHTSHIPGTELRPVWRGLALIVALVVVGLLAASAAHGEYYMSKRAAERAARHFVSHYYADTYASDLSTSCRPSGERYNPRFIYHRWVCNWSDSSDYTSGTVLIVGSRTPGGYYGKMLHGAH